MTLASREDGHRGQGGHGGGKTFCSIVNQSAWVWKGAGLVKLTRVGDEGHRAALSRRTGSRDLGRASLLVARRVSVGRRCVLMICPAAELDMGVEMGKEEVGGCRCASDGKTREVIHGISVLFTARKGFLWNQWTWNMVTNSLLNKGPSAAAAVSIPL